MRYGDPLDVPRAPHGAPSSTAVRTRCRHASCQGPPATGDLTTMSTEHPEFPLEQQHINRAAAALQTMQAGQRAKAGREGVGGSMRMTERAMRKQAEDRLERLLD